MGNIIGKLNLIGVTAAALATVVAGVWTALAQAADSFYQFQSPSGNIICGIGFINNSGFALCEIGNHTWVAPPRPLSCEGGWGDRIGMDEGSAPALNCHTDTLRGTAPPTLPYGTSRAAGQINCDSAPSGVTCTDAGTGHFFRISRESYELH
jgi:hypothetical protein